MSITMAAIESATLGSLAIPRIINGMWQVAGGHGVITPDDAVSEMGLYHDAGLTAWDMANIYGPAEEFLGRFRDGLDPGQRQRSVAFTKFVPSPGPMTRSIVEHHVDRSISRMNVDAIDLLQFHWWDYSNSSYLDALRHLEILRDEGKIRHLALTNFDTRRMEVMVDKGVTPVSNQVQHSVLDCRPQVAMAPFCQRYGIGMLAYGTLLGGFLSERYLGAAEPGRLELSTYSLQKYKNMIDAWGGWPLFQELLSALDQVAERHQASIANVAIRYVLDRPGVTGAIIGARLGIVNHIGDNLGTFSLRLCSDDYSQIEEVTTRSNDLYSAIGDCGSEYR